MKTIKATDGTPPRRKPLRAARNRRHQEPYRPSSAQEHSSKPSQPPEVHSNPWHTAPTTSTVTRISMKDTNKVPRARINSSRQVPRRRLAAEKRRTDPANRNTTKPTHPAMANRLDHRAITPSCTSIEGQYPMGLQHPSIPQQQPMTRAIHAATHRITNDLPAPTFDRQPSDGPRRQ